MPRIVDDATVGEIKETIGHLRGRQMVTDDPIEVEAIGLEIDDLLDLL